MIDFINDLEEYVEEKRKMKLIFQEPVNFSRNPFIAQFKTFLAFEFDKIYDESFYEGLMDLLKNTNSPEFTFYTLKPSSNEYFFNHFSKYSIAKIKLGEPYKEYIEFLASDPGNSPADALLYNSQTIAIYSDSEKWGILGSKFLEIAIIGFTEEMDQKKIIASFKNDLFVNVETRVNEIKSILDLSRDSMLMYSKIVADFTDR